MKQLEKMELKIPIDQKEQLLNTFESFKENLVKYIEFLKTYEFLYNINESELLNEYSERIFTKMYENDTDNLQDRMRGRNKEQFKASYIEKEGLNINEEISAACQNHLKYLNNFQSFIPGYNPENQYTIQFFTFEGCELHNILNKFIQHFYNYKRFAELVGSPYFGFPPFELQQSLQRYIRYSPSHGDTEPSILPTITADPNKPEFHTIIETITIEPILTQFKKFYKDKK